MRRPGWLSCARGRGAVLRGMRASARAVFAAGTSEIEKKKAGNVLTNITCLCFHYTIDEYGVSSLRKGRKCERNPSGVSFAFNSRAQATVCAADRFRSNKKRHAEACLFLLCFHYTIDVADGLFCREIDGLFCRSSPDIIVRRRCVLSHKRRGWLQPSPSFRYSRNLALQDELYHPVINNGPAVLVCVDKRLGTGPVNQSRDAG